MTGGVTKYFKVPADDEEELKKAVAFNGPVAVGINSKGLKLFKSSGKTIFLHISWVLVIDEIKNEERKSRPLLIELASCGICQTSSVEKYVVIK